MGKTAQDIDNLIQHTIHTFRSINPDNIQINAEKVIESFNKIIHNRQGISNNKKIELQHTFNFLLLKKNHRDVIYNILIDQLNWLFLEFLKIEIPDELVVYIGKYDIFLSYRHTDIEWVKILELNLKAQGYRIFRDEYQMIAGEEIRQRLYEAIEKSKYGVVIYPQNDDSKWIKEEIAWMRERQSRDASFKIIPIVMHTSEHLPDENILYIDFTHKDYERAFNELICAIKAVPPLKNHIKERLKFPQKIVAPLSLEPPTGTVPLDSHYYIQRKVDRRCYDILNSKYTLIRIKAPSQYGKTSLLTRLIAQAKEENYGIVYFNFQEFDKSLLENLNQLLEFICDMIAFELDIEVVLNPRIAKRLTPKTKATKKIQKILSKLNRPLVLAIDEADRLFSYDDISDEFFSLIRAWHEYAKSDPLWENLKIILAHSTEPLLGIKNINQSPFHNVGLGVELKPFNSDEIGALAQRHHISLSHQELESFITFLGGHPCLSRKVLYAIATENKTLTTIIEEAYSFNSIFKKHMQRYLLLIKENPKLISVLQEILHNKSNIDEKQCYILEATGLIKDTMGSIEFSCQLYHEFFQKRL